MAGLSPAVIQAVQQAKAGAAADQPQASKMNPTLHLLMQLLQATDAMNTSRFLHRPGTFETDPLLKPFAQAGNPLPMMGAFGMEDRAMNALPSQGTQNNAGLLQILLNLAGILKTNAAGH